MSPRARWSDYDILAERWKSIRRDVVDVNIFARSRVHIATHQTLWMSAGTPRRHESYSFSKVPEASADSDAHNSAYKS